MVTAEVNPIDIAMQQLRVIETNLIPFWGHGRTVMEYAPESDGDIHGSFIYDVPGGQRFTTPFHVIMREIGRGPNGENPLLEYIAKAFREFMLSMPYEIRMKGGPTEYPTDEELKG